MPETTRGPVLSGGFPGQIIVKRAADSNQTVWTDPSGIGLREALDDYRTYFVAPLLKGGRDENNGLSASSPFLTIQRAIDEVAKLDLGGFGATIQLAPGVYAPALDMVMFTGILLKDPSGGTNNGCCVIRGDPDNPSAYIIEGSSLNPFLTSSYMSKYWNFTGIKFDLIYPYTILSYIDQEGYVSFDKCIWNVSGDYFIFCIAYKQSFFRASGISITGTAGTTDYTFWLSNGCAELRDMNCAGAVFSLADAFIVLKIAGTLVNYPGWLNTSGITGRKFYVGQSCTLQENVLDSVPGTLPGEIVGDGVAMEIVNYSTETSMTMDTMVAAKPAGAAIALKQNGMTFSNEGATVIAPFTLPPAKVGLAYSFLVTNAFGLRVTAAAGNTIRVGPTESVAAGNISALAIGSTVTLKAVNASKWMASAAIGTWTFA